MVNDQCHIELEMGASPSVTFDRRQQLLDIQDKISDVYQFDDIMLLNECLTHTSVRDKDGKRVANYRRLHWIGNSILTFIVSSHILATNPNDTESDLNDKMTSLQV